MILSTENHWGFSVEKQQKQRFVALPPSPRPISNVEIPNVAFDARALITLKDMICGKKQP